MCTCERGQRRNCPDVDGVGVGNRSGAPFKVERTTNEDGSCRLAFRDLCDGPESLGFTCRGNFNDLMAVRQLHMMAAS